MSEVPKIVKVLGDDIEIWGGIVSRWEVRCGKSGQFMVVNGESFQFDSPMRMVQRWKVSISDPMRPNLEAQVAPLIMKLKPGPGDTVIFAAGAIQVDLLS